MRLRIQELIKEQLHTWPMARDNYNALANVIIRSISCGDYQIRLQFNSKRIISSSAKIDPKSLNERPCFLCTHNRPVEQKGIPYLNKYLLLVNPFPVFNPHFTVSSTEHQPQRIRENFPAMLSLAHDLADCVILYNGPNCGASAPDHFHFQAINKNNLPVEVEYKTRLTDKADISSHTALCRIAPYNRNSLVLISKDPDEAARVFQLIYNVLGEYLPFADEPMMNILTWFSGDKWINLIFPRKLHRPSQYFESGEKQILLSPASIDMGGVLIIPRKEDFDKITRPDMENIFSQVCVDDSLIDRVLTRFKKII